jgi:hypothetical protein
VLPLLLLLPLPFVVAVAFVLAVAFVVVLAFLSVIPKGDLLLSLLLPYSLLTIHYLL